MKNNNFKQLPIKPFDHQCFIETLQELVCEHKKMAKNILSWQTESDRKILFNQLVNCNHIDWADEIKRVNGWK